MFFEFTMERFQSLYENEVDFNLSDSGVHPLTINDLLNEKEMQHFLNMEIGYGYSQGDPTLRENISAWYKGKNKSNILVTNGSAEANFLTAWSLIDPDDEVILMLPNYMQVPGLAKIIGAKIKYIYLKEENDWHLDFNELRSLVSNQTKLISICNPSNPTGSVHHAQELQELAEVCRRHQVIVIADEIYALVNFSDRPFVGMATLYPEGTIVTSGLSKAFSAGGWRLGIALLPEAMNALVQPWGALVSEAFSCTSAPIQYAAVPAFAEYAALRRPRHPHQHRTGHPTAGRGQGHGASRLGLLPAPGTPDRASLSRGPHPRRLRSRLRVRADVSQNGGGGGANGNLLEPFLEPLVLLNLCSGASSPSSPEGRFRAGPPRRPRCIFLAGCS